MNFPSRHPLYAPPASDPITEPSPMPTSILGLEAQEMWTITHKMTGLKSFGMEIQLHHEARREDHQHLRDRAESQVQLSGLRPLRRSRPQHHRRRRSHAPVADRSREEADDLRPQAAPSQARGAKIAEANRKARERNLEAGRRGLGRQPHQHRAPGGRTLGADQERGLVAGFERPLFQLLAARACGTSSKHYQYIGAQGAAGIGYGAPAAVGAALANRKHGRLTVNIKSDGDLNYAPGVLWTAAHHRIPLLNIMHNNRAYHQERMYIQMVAAKHNRGIDRADIGTVVQQTPSSTTPRWPKPTACTAKAPSATPRTSGPALKRAHCESEIRRAGAGGCGDAAAVTNSRQRFTTYSMSQSFVINLNTTRNALRGLSFEKERQQARGRVKLLLVARDTAVSVSENES